MARPQASFSAFVELRQSLPSQVEVISPFVDQLMRFIKRFPNGDGSELDIEIAIREALANAILHGNQQNPRKRVYLILGPQTILTVQTRLFGSGALCRPLITNRSGSLFKQACLMQAHDTLRGRCRTSSCVRSALFV